MNPPASPGRSYRSVPVIHRAHWKWLVILYFFLGGIAGAAQMIAGIAGLRRDGESREIARTARMVSWVAFLPCPILLILDLRKPERFLNMLRILKLRSPMSIGSWALALFGGAATASVAGELLPQREANRSQWLRLVHRASGVVAPSAPPLGMVLAGYTGPLLAATAVPLWAKGSRWIGPLFLTSALSSAASSVEIALALRREPGEPSHTVGELEGICGAAEAVALAGWLLALGRFGQPLASGSAAKSFRHGAVGTGIVAPLAIRAATAGFPPGARRRAGLVAALLTLTGGFALRHAVIVAGGESADDPEATFAFASGPSIGDSGTRPRGRA